jgi:hypothetical protein
MDIVVAPLRGTRRPGGRDEVDLFVGAISGNPKRGRTGVYGARPGVSLILVNMPGAAGPPART